MAEDDRLQRIKFLVDQSKLYAQFLAASLEEPKTGTEVENGGDGTLNAPKAADPAEAKSKRRRITRASKPSGEQSQITSFFQPPPKWADQPKALKVKLHPYQITALKWLTMLYQNGLNGILADEMGLGKTLEVISFIAFLLENGVEGPFLVLGPLSTLGNWIAELQRFAPSISFTKYYGTPSERTELRRQCQGKNGSLWGNLVISSYEIVMADQRFLQKIDWKYIIVDEGHRLKNVDSKLMRVLKSFSSANRMLLTGTPLQNNLTELWSLLNFLLPDIFTDLSIFHSWFESGEISITSTDEDSLVTSLHDILRPFLLRRLKRDVGLNLPSKREHVIFLGLTELQQDLYQSFLNTTAREFVVDKIIEDKKEAVKSERTSSRGKRSKGKAPKRGKEKEEIDDDSVLDEGTEALIKQARQELKMKSFSNLVMQLRLTCNSPYLFWYPHQPDFANTSSKLQFLERLMQRLLPEKHKVLIFTQFTRMLDIMEDWATGLKYRYNRLDGSTKQDERQRMIEEFADPASKVDIFMLTTRSGGQGINLVAADTVIIFDSDWNPQQDLQAMDRVHRIGQTKPTLVLRLCMGDTVEQDLLERAATKLELNHLVIESGQFKGPTLPSNANNATKVHALEEQLERHRSKFQKGTVSQITDSDLDALLDRSPEAYVNAKENIKIGESILCINSDI